MVPDWWIALAAGLAAAALLAAALLLWRRRRGTDPRQALNAIALEQMRGVLVPDGMGGQIYVEHLLLTVHGLVVVDVKNVGGVVFASDLMNDWTVIGSRGRFTLPNPQGNLYDRVAAVRQLVRDAPVSGYVLFSADADFSKGRPRDVVLPPELVESHAKPERGEAERIKETFASAWQSVREAVEPARR